LKPALRRLTGATGGVFLTDRAVLDAGREMLIIALKLSLPVLMFGLVAGVLVSLFQAVTQIQEFTLTFVPKLLAVILALAIFGPWMLNSLISFFKMTFTHMPPVTN
jgi:flagellar biosynthetic protein FliQ